MRYFENEILTALLVILFLPFFQCLDLSNLQGDGLARILIWSFELIPAPAAQYVRPSVIDKDSPLNDYFPPVELDEYRCNCSSSTSLCLVAMVPKTYADLLSDPAEEDSPVMSEDDYSLPADDDKDNSDCHPDSDPEEVEYFSETFSVKGSFWATRFQDALKKAVDLKATENDVPVRASFEPSNLKDKNAITFEVFDSGFGWSLATVEWRKFPSLQKL